MNIVEKDHQTIIFYFFLFVLLALKKQLKVRRGRRSDVKVVSKHWVTPRQFKTDLKVSIEMAHLQYLDDLVREYLLYRGFSGTMKIFDSELKADKDKGFRVCINLTYNRMMFTFCFRLHRELLLIAD